jgi:hypothetical protein
MCDHSVEAGVVASGVPVEKFTFVLGDVEGGVTRFVVFRMVEAGVAGALRTWLGA